MRTLTLVELNRATLARQLLLERRKVGILPALERLAGLQAQGKVTVTPFAPLPRTARREVDDEAARLEAWLR